MLFSQVIALLVCFRPNQPLFLMTCFLELEVPVIRNGSTESIDCNQFGLWLLVVIYNFWESMLAFKVFCSAWISFVSCVWICPFLFLSFHFMVHSLPTEVLYLFRAANLFSLSSDPHRICHHPRKSWRQRPGVTELQPTLTPTHSYNKKFSHKAPEYL